MLKYLCSTWKLAGHFGLQYQLLRPEHFLAILLQYKSDSWKSLLLLVLCQYFHWLDTNMPADINSNFYYCGVIFARLLKSLVLPVLVEDIHCFIAIFLLLGISTCVQWQVCIHPSHHHTQQLGTFKVPCLPSLPGRHWCFFQLDLFL